MQNQTTVVLDYPIDTQVSTKEQNGIYKHHPTDKQWKGYE